MLSYWIVFIIPIFRRYSKSLCQISVDIRHLNVDGGVAFQCSSQDRRAGTGEGGQNVAAASVIFTISRMSCKGLYVR